MMPRWPASFQRTCPRTPEADDRSSSSSLRTQASIMVYGFDIDFGTLAAELANLLSAPLSPPLGRFGNPAAEYFGCAPDEPSLAKQLEREQSISAITGATMRHEARA